MMVIQAKKIVDVREREQYESVLAYQRPSVVDSANFRGRGDPGVLAGESGH